MFDSGSDLTYKSCSVVELANQHLSGTDWKTVFEFRDDALEKTSRILMEMAKNDTVIYPNISLIYEPFFRIELKDVRVIIVQDRCANKRCLPCIHQLCKQKKGEGNHERWHASFRDGHDIYAAGGGDCHVHFWRVPSALGQFCLDRSCRFYRRVHTCHRRAPDLGP